MSSFESSPPSNNVALIIPVLNAQSFLPKLLPAVFEQSLLPSQILFIDSESNDSTCEILNQYSIHTHKIERNKFDHGGTRKLACELIDAEIYIFMTQDAYPASKDTFKNIIAAFKNVKNLGCAYGRQLPKEDANLWGRYERLFNYPEHSQIRSYSDKNKYGIKTFFNSNSFAAYSKEALNNVGGFPNKLISSEDAYVAAKMLLNGYQVAYVAEAPVYHSHNFTILEKFHRYFSVGVFHAKQSWIIENFVGATSEGFKYLFSEIKYLVKKRKVHLIPYAFYAKAWCYLAYQLGLYEKYLPLFIKKHWGVNKKYWIHIENEN